MPDTHSDARHYLRIYIADHHAGSVGARVLLDRMLDDNQREPIHETLQTLRAELDEDAEAVDDVAQALGVRPSAVKDRLAGIFARAGRLKRNGQTNGYSPLSRLLELEGLRAGIAAKLCLWRTLRANSWAAQRLHEFDLQRLERRALDQLEAVDHWHAWAAERLPSAAAGA